MVKSVLVVKSIENSNRLVASIWSSTVKNREKSIRNQFTENLDENGV